MIPLRDNIRSRRFPVVNITIIIVNFLIFIYQIQLSPRDAYSFVLDFGVVPVELVGGLSLFLEGNPDFATVLPGATVSLFTATFLHGGWLHLLGNMIYLWVFGDNIEDRMGSMRYLLVYLLMGAGGSIVHIMFNPVSTSPLIGASGAIAGVLGIYLLLYPGAKVLTLLPLGFFITFVHIPAILFLAFWFLLQLFNAFLAQGAATGAQPVAWWAHVGGFLIGLAIGILHRAGERIR